MYLFLYFLKFILSIFLENHIGNKCAVVCFNVSILGIYYIYIYMYYNVLPNKLTHNVTSTSQFDYVTKFMCVTFVSDVNK